MLAGNATQKKVVESLNNIGNVMNLQMDAHKAYDRLLWGIEAVGCDGKVRSNFETTPIIVADRSVRSNISSDLKDIRSPFALTMGMKLSLEKGPADTRSTVLFLNCVISNSLLHAS